MHCTTKKGIFCLCIENVMHVLETFFQINSWCWKVRNRRQKVINSRTFRVWRTAWHSENLIKTPLIDIVGALFGGGSPQNFPWWRDRAGLESEMAVSVPLRAMSSLWFTTLLFALNARSAIMRTRIQTTLSKLVEYRSSHQLLHQLRKLGSD